MRVLYSFPHKLGDARICYTAWQQVSGLAQAGAEVLTFPGVLHKPLPSTVAVQPTLSRGKLRIPYKAVGTERACAMHDWLVSRRIEKLAGHIDIIHTWPLGSVRTLRAAARLGIPTVLERPNAHTRFAYTVVEKECRQLGLALPRRHEHAYNPGLLQKEEVEYNLAFRLLCPSDFVARTFCDEGFNPARLARHQYGYDERLYFPDLNPRPAQGGLRMLFAGGCAPRKGLHYALAAWMGSTAHRHGRFLIAGAFVPGYAERLSPMLDHPSVQVLGHRNDIAQLMRMSDVLILPSIEEGSALVTSEARGSGCVILVSEAAGAVCTHMGNALVHRVGDVVALTQHITLVDTNRELLGKLRNASLSTLHEITWQAAGVKLLNVYKETVAAHSHRALVGV